MTKLYAVVLLATAVLGCQSKKPSTTPPPTDQSLERKEGATGGAAYGGHKPDAPKDAPAPK